MRKRVAGMVTVAMGLSACTDLPVAQPGHALRHHHRHRSRRNGVIPHPVPGPLTPAYVLLRKAEGLKVARITPLCPSRVIA
jgi:hypothetical protein